MNIKLTGLIAAPHTPFHEDDTINYNLIRKQADWLSSNSVIAAFVCGTTGEWSSLTTTERMAITEHWIAVAPRDLKIIVHVGHNCLSDAQLLAAHANKAGAYAVAAIAPDYFRPATLNALVEFCSRIAAAAPNLPFYYYHMPAMNGVTFAVIDFLKVAAERIPNLAGVKYTFENLMDYRQCVAFDNGRFNILFGRDEIMLSALAMGAEGFVGSTYNFAAATYHKVIGAFQNKDMKAAQAHQTQAIEMINALSRYGGLSAGKAVMKMLGMDCGPVRAPLQSISAEAYEKLQHELRVLNLLPTAK
ncbi:MAG: dihydrodipicolinate synthase family protein [Verrucomicrobia bacterium]|nr:dihydrodipicolinate synthase family protein [Verrucomicrobiota bacterium]